jgi:hypothetical protein
VAATGKKPAEWAGAGHREGGAGQGEGPCRGQGGPLGPAQPHSQLLPRPQATWSIPTAQQPIVARPCPARWPWSMTASLSRGGSELDPRISPASPPASGSVPDTSPCPQVVLPRGR